MKGLLKLFAGSSKPNETIILRQGKAVSSDPSFNAWTSGDLDEMLKASKSDTNPIDRHFLLQQIVSETYKLRQEIKYKNLCVEFSERYLDEFKSGIFNTLKDDFNGDLPGISVFRHYVTLLTELGDYDRAIEVCKIAISYKIEDGTKSGYAGRIARIEKKRNSSE